MVRILKKPSFLSVTSSMHLNFSGALKWKSGLFNGKISIPFQTLSSPDESCHQAVNENEEFCCIFKSRLGSNSVLYGAEMDGFKLCDAAKKKSGDDVDLSTDGVFVELKTSRLIENDRQMNSFCRYKTLKWWAQSFMVSFALKAEHF